MKTLIYIGHMEEAMVPGPGRDIIFTKGLPTIVPDGLADDLLKQTDKYTLAPPEAPAAKAKE